jgi:hypothetical protein
VPVGEVARSTVIPVLPATCAQEMVTVPWVSLHVAG